jgi:hypothetical protein
MILHDDLDRKPYLSLLEEEQLQRRVDRLRGARREGRKGRIAKKQA